MDTTPQASDDTIMAAGSYRPCLPEDTIKPGPPRQSITPAAPPPSLSDDDVRDLVKEIAAPMVAIPRREGMIDYVVGGMKLTCCLGLFSSIPILSASSHQPGSARFGTADIIAVMFSVAFAGALLGSVYFGLKRLIQKLLKWPL